MCGSISLGCLTPSVLYRVGESGLEGVLADALSSDPLLSRLIHPINPRAIKTYELLDDHETPNFMDDMSRGGPQAHFNVCSTLYREALMRKHGFFFVPSCWSLHCPIVYEPSPFSRVPDLDELVKCAEENCNGEIAATPTEVAAQCWEETYGMHIDGRGLTCVSPLSIIGKRGEIRPGQMVIRNVLSYGPVLEMFRRAHRPYSTAVNCEPLYATLGFITNDEEIAACGALAYAQAFGDGHFTDADPIIRYCVERRILKHQPIDDWRPEWRELLRC